MSGSPDLPPDLRRCARVLRMVHELHKRGYQRLRVIPYIGSANHWRCVVTHAGAIYAAHGAWGDVSGYWCARYSAAQDNEYFGWTDAKNDTAADLATKLLDRFPHLLHMGMGRDWIYAGWYLELMRFADRGELPVALWGGMPRTDPRFLPTLRFVDSGLPMPPGGELPLPTPEAEAPPPATGPFNPDAPIRRIPFSDAVKFLANL